MPYNVFISNPFNWYDDSFDSRFYTSCQNSFFLSMNFKLKVSPGSLHKCLEQFSCYVDSSGSGEAKPF